MNDFEQGILYYNEKKYNEAKECFTRVIHNEPNNYVAYHNLGIICIHLNQNEDAIGYFKISCESLYVESFISRGAAYRNLGKYLESMHDFATAFTLNPDHATAYSNYSNLLREFGRPDIALDFIKIANRIKPDNTSLLNESITYLSLGNLTEGWKKYNYRWFYETGKSLKPDLPGEEYDGTQNINGLRVLVYHEQGFGDCIQFARYIKLLEQLNAKVILLSKPKLVELMKYNFPNVFVIPWGDGIPEYHYHVALLDLPKCFNTTVDNIPNPTSYISVDEGMRNHWKNLLGEKTKLRVGLTWTSNGLAYNTKFRKMELNELVNVISDDYEFINLHFDPAEDEKKLLEKYDVKSFDMGDFYSTAGLISNLDCVISVDTVTAHLAASLGIPTFIILPNYGCDWRWFLNRNDSPFYSCVKLFRKVNDNFDSVIQDLKLHLKHIG